ncbi:MAG: hypothetical protein ACRD7E_03805 [Bryobacteraceae bacterium]
MPAFRNAATCLALVGVILGGNFGFSQSDATLPAPLLNADGSIPEQHKDRYVFIDPRTGNGVAIYSSRLANDNADTKSQRDVRFEIPLQRHVEPSIRSELIKRDSNYSYRFTLANGSAAKLRAHTWVADVPALGTDTTISEPSGWRHVVAPPIPAGVIKTPLPEIPLSLRPLRWLPISTTPEESSSGIPPGEARSGFGLVSRKKPGLLWCYVFGYVPLLHIESEPPAVVQEQMSRLFDISFNAKRTVFIGPKFDSTVDRATVIRDYLREIKKLDAAALKSPFMIDLMRRLSTDKPIANLSRFDREPTSPLERELLNGLRLALE